MTEPVVGTGVHRVMGIETEYGILTGAHSSLDPVAASALLVNAYAHAQGFPNRRGHRWDYATEQPLRDARGFDMSRAEADPSQLTDVDDGLPNLVLTNGARFYVDHAHPEYSSPEVTNPRDAVCWDRAGEVVLQQARAAALQQRLVDSLDLFKNNIDNKGASYGTHENFLVARQVPFADLVHVLTPFLITRQIWAGAGRVGLGERGETAGFQLSQRADYIQKLTGLETTMRRPIVNTRDEPHADPTIYRRLHLIIGDANVADIPTWLKLGITALILAGLEREFWQDIPELAHPVAAVRQVSADLTFQSRIELADGTHRSALEVQRWYLQQCERLCEHHGWADTQTLDVLHQWDALLTDLEALAAAGEVGDPHIWQQENAARLATQIDWAAKLRLLSRSLAKRSGSTNPWQEPKLSWIDMQYANIDPQQGFGLKLRAAGALESLCSSQEAQAAATKPPTNTRAYFRGECLRRFRPDIAAASWDSIIFETSPQEPLRRLQLLDPLKGTQALVGELLSEVDNAQALLTALRTVR